MEQENKEQALMGIVKQVDNITDDIKDNYDKISFLCDDIIKNVHEMTDSNIHDIKECSDAGDLLILLSILNDYIDNIARIMAHCINLRDSIKEIN